MICSLCEKRTKKKDRTNKLFNKPDRVRSWLWDRLFKQKKNRNKMRSANRLFILGTIYFRWWLNVSRWTNTLFGFVSKTPNQEEIRSIWKAPSVFRSKNVQDHSNPLVTSDDKKIAIPFFLSASKFSNKSLRASYDSYAPCSKRNPSKIKCKDAVPLWNKAKRNNSPFCFNWICWTVFCILCVCVFDGFQTDKQSYKNEQSKQSLITHNQAS